MGGRGEFHPITLSRPHRVSFLRALKRFLTLSRLHRFQKMITQIFL
jgi:hypothetical protein